MRRLCATMFTDIVGSTALTQRDEGVAHRQRTEHRAALETAVARWRGELIQYYGDGALIIFDSAVDAVMSAIDIQRALDGGVPLRIGIHSGDVMQDSDGVFGDSVNIASRLESLSVAGGVLISGKVVDEVKNQSGVLTLPLGEFDLKNVAHPIPVFAVVNEGLAVPTAADLPDRVADDAASIAVLPFTNMSADPDNEYFADGIAEEILNALTRVNGLKVTARTSSFAFKGKNQDIREIGTTLGVSTVLEGSVRKAGDRVRITAQLIETQTGYHLFSETYSRTLEDIFGVQDEIALLIVKQIEPHLLKGLDEDELETHVWVPEAYTEYLHGRFQINRWTPASVNIAIGHLDRALELDPDAAAAHAARGMGLLYLGGLGQTSQESYREAGESARRAIELDPTSGDAHTMLALYNLLALGDSQSALDSAERAVSLSPGSAMVHFARTMVFLDQRRFDEAVEAAETAVQLDPLSPLQVEHLGQVYLDVGRYGEAVEQCEKALGIDPGFRAATLTMAWARLGDGNHEEAGRLMETLPIMAGFPAAGAAPRGYLYARTGRPADARAMLELIDERGRGTPDLDLDTDRAVIYLGLGEYDLMFEALERSLTRNPGGRLFLRAAVMWDEIRDDPRTVRLLESNG